MYLVLKNNTAYLAKDENDSPNKYLRLILFEWLNIYVEFGGLLYQQTVGVPVCTNCARLVADLILYSYEANFVQRLQKSKFKKQKHHLNSLFAL